MISIFFNLYHWKNIDVYKLTKWSFMYELCSVLAVDNIINLLWTIACCYRHLITVLNELCVVSCDDSDSFVDSLAPGRCGSVFEVVIFDRMQRNKFMSTSCEIILRWMQESTFHYKSINGSGNGLVLSDNKPLSEPMLTQIFVAIWCHYATMICIPSAISATLI